MLLHSYSFWIFNGKSINPAGRVVDIARDVDLQDIFGKFVDGFWVFTQATAAPE